MVNAIRERLYGLAGQWRSSPRLSAGLLVIVAAGVAFAIVVYLWRGDGDYRPLYGAGEPFAAADVMSVLDSEKIDWHLHPQSGQVLVRARDLARARLMLSAKGVSVAVPAGYDLFDHDEALGTSQFIQDVRLKRSLEGELARTIMALEGVDAARVLLALQERNSFVVSTREPSSASVMLQLHGGGRLSDEQVRAIINLVANSVPNLNAGSVSVVDQHGSLLSRGLDEDQGPSHGWQAVADYQLQAASNAEAVLAPILGAGNYRVSVTADIDFSQKEETLQAFGDVPRLRNEVLQDESVLDQLALGVPGSLSNRPPAPASAAKGKDAKGADTGNPAATSLRKESSRQMDYDQSVTHIKHPGFSVRQQSIAVLLNAAAAPEGGFSDAAREELAVLLKSAVGFNPGRGDLLTLSVFAFAPPQELTGDSAWWASEGLQGWARLGVLALVSLLLAFLVVRPAMRQFLNRELPGAASTGLSVAGEARPEGGADATERRLNPALNPLAEINLPAPGSGLEVQVEHLQLLAEHDPERVSEVLKQWIGRNENALDA